MQLAKHCMCKQQDLRKLTRFHCLIWMWHLGVSVSCWRTRRCCTSSGKHDFGAGRTVLQAVEWTAGENHGATQIHSGQSMLCLLCLQVDYLDFCLYFILNEHIKLLTICMRLFQITTQIQTDTVIFKFKCSWNQKSRQGLEMQPWLSNKLTLAECSAHEKCFFHFFSLFAWQGLAQVLCTKKNRKQIILVFICFFLWEQLKKYEQNYTGQSRIFFWFFSYFCYKLFYFFPYFHFLKWA